MLLRILFGRYQGEIRDIAPEAALAMLKDGRAENPFAEPPVAEPPAQRPEPVIEYEVEEHPWASEEGNAPCLPAEREQPAAPAPAEPRRRRRGKNA